jgi:alcohol dehydrogenase class IV
MLRDYVLTYPPVIHFGSGCRFLAGDLLRRAAGGPQPRTFAVCSRTLRSAGALDELSQRTGLAWCGVYDHVPHDPPLECVDTLIEQLSLSSADAVLAIGGGSVIDAAKTAAAIAPTADGVRPFFEGQRSLSRPGLPLVALPTTAGTGAEITPNAVLSDHLKGAKKSIRSPFLVPAAALVDPDLTVSMPPDLTAHSGLDALTQAIESYVSLQASAVSRPLAAAAVARLLPHLPQACRDGSDLAARTQVAEGSLLGAMAFSQSGLGAVHGLAHPIGHALSLPHGLTCAILLPHILRLNLPACADELDALAGGLGLGSATAFVQATGSLCAELGMPDSFAAFRLAEADHAAIVANCRSGSMKANPRHLADEELLALLRRLS